MRPSRASLGDTAATMMAFCALLPASVPRIALVDYTNDCVGTSLDVMRRMFAKYRELIDAGRDDEAAALRALRRAARHRQYHARRVPGTTR